MVLPVTPLCNECKILLSTQTLLCPICNKSPPLTPCVYIFAGYYVKHKFDGVSTYMKFAMYTGLLTSVKDTSIYQIVLLHFFKFGLRIKKVLYEMDIYRLHLLKIADFYLCPNNALKNKNIIKLAKRCKKTLDTFAVNNFLNDVRLKKINNV